MVVIFRGGGGASGPPVPPLDVDCILASYIAYRSSNKTQFCSMVVHEHHKSDLTEGSDEFARIQKVSPEGYDFDNVFFS